MAAYTSTQSGNFNDTATWGGGGYPSADGDTFTVASGHTVTYNIATPLTEGFGDSTIIGTLVHAAGSTEIRMNGRLFINGGGLYEMVPGSIHWINGSQADQHGIWVRNQQGSIKTTGTEAMHTTTLSSAASYGATRLSFTSAEYFAVGDWIAVYRDEPSSIDYDNDEGLIIHDISTNDVYFRQFVTPTAIVVSYAGADLIVDNAKVFRVGQKIIVGTGSNRNVKTINAIDYKQNLITCDANLTGTIDGLTVYLTGTIRIHDSGEIVRKNATTLASGENQSSTSITLTNARGFNINDEIVLEHNYSANNNTTWSTGDRYTITNITDNTLTITPGLSLAVAAGGYVTKWNRDCSIRSDSGDFGFVYIEAYTSNYSRIIHFKNTEFRGLGNSASGAYRGLCIRGYGSTSFRTNGFMVEGCSFDSTTYSADRAPLWLYNYGHYSSTRNNVLWNSYNGISDYYNYNNTVVNNFMLNMNYTGIRTEGSQGETHTTAFNRAHRINSYGLMYYANYETGEGFHHNSVENVNQYASYISNSNAVDCWQNEFINFRYPPARDWPNDFKTIYCKFQSYEPGVVGLGRPLGSAYGGPDRGAGNYSFMEFLEHNYEYDTVAQITFYATRYWDSNENAWKFWRNHASSGNAGFFNEYFLPAGSSIQATFTVKLDPTWNGTQPYGTIRSLTQTKGINANLYGDTNGGKVVYPFAFVDTQASFTTTEYNSLTISATNTSPRGTIVLVGLYSTSSNASEGWWQKPDIVKITPVYPNSSFILTSLMKDAQSVPKLSNDFNSKLIIGGSVIR